MGKKEFVTLVDENDNVIGKKDRDLLTDDDRWRVVSIWVTNPQGDILIAQRGLTKKLGAGLWSCAAEGTVEHPDSYEQTANREIVEEVGVAANLEPTHVGNFLWSFGKRACMGFKGVIDLPIEAFKIPKDEVEAIQWIKPYKLWEEVETRPEKFISHFKSFKELFEL